MSNIYELRKTPVSPDKWVTEDGFTGNPSAFPIADWINVEQDRDTVIAHFGAWLEKNGLGVLDGEMFTVAAEAANRHFEGRFAAFQKAVSALQALNETQFIHDHDWVAAQIDNLDRAFTQKYGDYVLWGDDMTPMPLDEFLRKAQPGQRYFFGAVFRYK